MAEVKSLIICRLHTAQNEGEAEGTSEEHPRQQLGPSDSSPLFPDLSGRLPLGVAGLCRTRLSEMREEFISQCLRKVCKRYKPVDLFCLINPGDLLMGSGI